MERWKADPISDTLIFMNQLAKVLVVFKKSTFQLQAVEHKEPRFLKLLEEGHANVAKVKTSHSEHYDTLEKLHTELERRKIQYTSIARADLDHSADEYDLVISVGGDGTFLDASHAVRSAPILGVNSARSTSFGHFCIGNIENVGDILDQIISGEIKPRPLLRLECELNGKVLPELILNEVLVAHTNPAGTSRYYIEIDGVREEQRSSGIWIGTASGSTGSIKSAGGAIMPIISEQYQYVVRESWTRPGQVYRLTHGLLNRDQEIHMTCNMRTGALYIDGQHIEYSFLLGEELVIRPSRTDLLAYINPHVNDIFDEG